jgi:hypothetical protein
MPNLSEDEFKYNYNYLLAQTHINQNIMSYCQSISHYYVKPKITWNITKVDSQYYFAEKI